MQEQQKIVRRLRLVEPITHMNFDQSDDETTSIFFNSPPYGTDWCFQENIKPFFLGPNFVNFIKSLRTEIALRGLNTKTDYLIVELFNAPGEYSKMRFSFGDLKRVNNEWRLTSLYKVIVDGPKTYLEFTPPFTHDEEVD